MKKFLIQLLKFMVPIVVLAYPLDLLLSYMLKQSHEYPGEFEVMNDIYNGKAECELAIYGSSRAWVHFSPDILSDSLKMNVYNFGIDGHNFQLQYLRHLELLTHVSPPKTIVLSVDIYSLQKRTELYHPDQFIPYMLWNRNIRSFTSGYEGFKQMDYYLPLSRFAGRPEVLRSIVKNVMNAGKDIWPYRKKGFAAIDRPWTGEFERAKKEMRSYKVGFHPPTMELLERFIIECKEANINLILVYSPEYIEGQKFVLNRDEVIDHFKVLASKYDLLFLDYSESEICFDRKYFYNANHLNREGATLFSSQLARDIRLSNSKR